MQIINEIILDMICILFPLTVYIIFLAYFRNKDEKKKEIFLEIALYSSMYLLIKFSKGRLLIYPMIILNMPLLISYLKTNRRVSFIISIILIIYYYINKDVNISIIYLIVEYLIYFIGCSYLYIKEYSKLTIISFFIIIKSFIISLEMSFVFNPTNSLIINYLLIIVIMSIFTIIGYTILFLLNKSEDIIDLNNIVHELEKEKKLRESLFKITHEVKNPIAVCKGYLDMIDYEDIQKIKKYIPIIKDEISRTLILMDDFLDYTKIKIEKDIVDVSILLEDTIDIMKPLFKKNHIRIDYEELDDEIYLELDYNRMKQVLVNILKNSIEAKDDKKKDKYIKIDVIKKTDAVIIKIKDNGIGMSSKTLERISEMFYTTKEKGTGLGVALSKEIIKQHNGSINYTSVINKYTITTITLPYNEKNY